MHENARKKIEATQSEVATKVFAAREYALTRVIGCDIRGKCLFGKHSYKEVELATRQATVKEYAQEISFLKAAMVELMKIVQSCREEAGSQ